MGATYGNRPDNYVKVGLAHDDRVLSREPGDDAHFWSRLHPFRNRIGIEQKAHRFFFRPRFIGMSLFLTTPAFLWIFIALREIRRDVVVAATGAAALLALLPDLFHGTVGFQQFGYRFSIDAQPFLVALALSGDGLFRGIWRRWPTIIFILAIVLSLAVNIYATIAITRFEYWQ